MTIFLFLVGNLGAFLEKLLQPFFTNKPTGLGLSLNYGLIKEHNGEFQADSLEGEGNIFTTSTLLLSSSILS